MLILLISIFSATYKWFYSSGVYVNSCKFKLEFSRAYPQNWLTCWSKENSGYDGIMCAVGKWKLIGIQHW